MCDIRGEGKSEAWPYVGGEISYQGAAGQTLRAQSQRVHDKGKEVVLYYGATHNTRRDRGA